VGRGLQLIADGVVGRSSVCVLATQLGVTERHHQRLFKDEVGTTLGVIARSRRARLARQLLTETAMPITQVAFAAGFASVRTFNDTMRQICRVTPSDLRRGRPAATGMLQLQHDHRRPLPVEALLARLREDAIPGVEDVVDGSYRRAVRFDGGHAVVVLTPGSDHAILTVESDTVAPLAPIVQRARPLMDLDADPATIHDHLMHSPELEHLVKTTPGMRQVGAFEPFEAAVHAVLRQGSMAATARHRAGRTAARFGTPITTSSPTITRLFPGPGPLSEVDLTDVGPRPWRADTVKALARAVDDGALSLDGSTARPIDGVGRDDRSIEAGTTSPSNRS
jgi:AraC family transcriptional regulator of adaptative response / DNA-3-methyladenine glycosylase II